MAVKQKATGRATSMPAGLAWGALCSIITILLGTGITAKLIESEVMEWGNAGYPILITLILSAWLGGIISFRKIKRQRTAVCFTSGLLLFVLLLLITALFFGGQYSGVGETALLIACGSALAIFPGHERKNKRKIRLYNR